MRILKILSMTLLFGCITNSIFAQQAFLGVRISMSNAYPGKPVLKFVNDSQIPQNPACYTPAPPWGSSYTNNDVNFQYAWQNQGCVTGTHSVQAPILQNSFIYDFYKNQTDTNPTLRCQYFYYLQGNNCVVTAAAIWPYNTTNLASCYPSGQQTVPLNSDGYCYVQFGVVQAQ